MVILFHISTLDINKPLDIEGYKCLRAKLKKAAIKNIFKSLPVVLTYILFVMYGGKTAESIAEWLHSLTSIQFVNQVVFVLLGIFLFFVIIISGLVLSAAIKTLADMDLTSEELKLLQEQVHVSGDKVCAKYLVDVHDMGRRLLSCEKKIILKRLEELKKEEEIKNLRGML